MVQREALPYWRLSLYNLSYFAFLGIFAPYFSLYLAALGWTAGAIAAAMALMQAMRVLAPPLWSLPLERGVGHVALLRRAAVMALAAGGVFLVASEPRWVLPAVAVIGFCWSGALPVFEALTFAHLREEAHRYARIRLWGSIGFIFAVLGLGHWLERDGVETLPVWLVAALAGGALMAFALPEPTPTRVLVRTLPPWRTVLARREVTAFLLASFAMSAAHGPLYVFYSMHLDRLGYGKEAIGALWALGVASEIVLFWALPGLLRRFTVRTLLFVAYGAAVVRFLAIGWGGGWPVVVVLAQLLHAATFGVFHGANVHLLRQWFPGPLLTRGQALYGSLSFGAGGMLGAMVSGWSWSALGPEWTYTLGSAFALSGMGCVAIALRQGASVDDEVVK